MGKKVLQTLGYDSEKQIVCINDASKSNSYTCPQCGERIVVRNGGKLQRPHFSHFKKSTQHCSGISVLQTFIQQQIKKILQTYIDQKEPFFIQWSCPYCNKQYNIDLLQRACSLSICEKIDDYTIPILLKDKEEEPIIAIEILIHRKLTKKIIERYESKGIILIQLQVSEKDWSHIEYKLQHPDKVSFCSNKECYNFQFYAYAFRREIFLQKFKCKKCGKVVDGYMVRNTSAFGKLGLDNLTLDEKKEIIDTYFRGKRATQADIVVYGKCRCIPHSKGLVCLNKNDDFKETRHGKIANKK